MSATASSPVLPFRADFAAMAENLPEMSWIASPSGRIVWANRLWRDYVGTSQEQVGVAKWENIHDPALVFEPIHRLLAGLKVDLRQALNMPAAEAPHA